MDYDRVTLDTINGGVAHELFDEELKRVLENIQDQNSKPDATREITLKFKITPDKHRRQAATSIQASSKIAPVDPKAGFMIFAGDGTSIEAFTTDPRQQNLPLEEEEPPNVTKMRSGEHGE